MSTYAESRIGSAQVGCTGTPGSCYEVLWVGVADMGGFFEARAKWARGSNQGYLEEHDSLRGRARGDSIAASLSDLLDDVVEWDLDFPAGQIRSAFRECQYEAEDAA